MSKMGAEFIRTADDRADATALEVAELRAEVERLEAQNARFDAACRRMVEALAPHHFGGREPFPGDQRYADAHQGLYDSLEDSERGFGGRKYTPTP